MLPHVSILIPTFNRAAYLSETLASALGQTLRAIEVVVVDDGSTDGTGELVRAIQDERLRYLYQQNRGISAALNTAWRAARGEYVAMLGSDDVMLPHQIETLYGIAARDPGLGVVYARGQGMDERGNPLPTLFGGPMHFDDALSSLLYANCICVQAALARRDLVAQVGGFNEQLVANEDWDLWIRLAEIARFYFHDEILARYRLHGASMTGGASAHYDRVIQGRVHLIESYLARGDVPLRALTVRALALRNVYMDATIRYLSSGRRRAALPYFGKALGTETNPLATALRVTGVALFDMYLSKTRWGVRAMEALTRWRHRNRAARARAQALDRSPSA